jgi:hypothetical protein
LGGAWDGSTFTPRSEAEKLAEQQAIIDARLGAAADGALVSALGRAVFEMYDRLAAAGISGFPALTDQQKREFIRDRF